LILTGSQEAFERFVTDTKEKGKERQKMLHDVKGCGYTHAPKQYNYHVCAVDTAMRALPILQAREDAATLRANVHLLRKAQSTRKGAGCFAMSVQVLFNADAEYVCAS
jgi:hypothetical protein